MNSLYFLNFLNLNAQVWIFWDKPFLGNCWDHLWREWLAIHVTSTPVWRSRFLHTCHLHFGFPICIVLGIQFILILWWQWKLGCLLNWRKAAIYALAPRFPDKPLSLILLGATPLEIFVIPIKGWNSIAVCQSSSFSLCNLEELEEMGLVWCSCWEAMGRFFSSTGPGIRTPVMSLLCHFLGLWIWAVNSFEP